MKVFINPGHAPNGVPDPGACNSTTGLRESDVTYSVGRLVEAYLIAAGVETELLQSDILSDVCYYANASGADIFVSIHCNSAASEYAEGTETWMCHGSEEGRRLAECIQDQIVDSLETVDRGIKIATPGVNGLCVLTNTDMPAVLVELAFISNAEEEQILRNNQDEFARAIARGITDYI